MSSDRRKEFLYLTGNVFLFLLFSNLDQHDDELLEKQIEEKEKILAKMLNLESLSIAAPLPAETDELPTMRIEIAPVITDTDSPKTVINDTGSLKPVIIDSPKLVVTGKKEISAADLVPKVVKLPNNWNLEDIELKLDVRNGFMDQVISPDDNLDSEWEII